MQIFSRLSSVSFFMAFFELVLREQSNTDVRTDSRKPLSVGGFCLRGLWCQENMGS